LNVDDFTIIFAVNQLENLSMKLTILGCNGALPAHGRFPTCQILDLGAEMMMIDCGEGSQIQMQKFAVRSSRVDHVFISHMHGDHYFGLIGWLNTQALMQREKVLHLYCPEILKQIIEIQLLERLSFEIQYHFLLPNEKMVLMDTEKYKVLAFPVDHSIETHGFLFEVKREKRILKKEKVQEYEIPKYYYRNITLGKDYETKDGEIISYEVLSDPPKPNLKYAYCADTAFNENLIPYVTGVDILFHEATYTKENVDKAIARKHSTAEQAALIAQKAGVKQLLIGHYSSKYKTTDAHEAEAKTVFENTIAVYDGFSIEVK
jgi:ribonuclease Z